MRGDLSPLDQLLLEGAFAADDMSDLVRERAAKRLARADPTLVASNTDPAEAEAEEQGAVVRSEGEIESIGRNAREQDWREQVADVVIGAPSATEATEHLLGRWSALRLLESPATASISVFGPA